jgi:phospholipid/cholesterol/gamma-HCH transport system ATP-binding protein
MLYDEPTTGLDPLTASSIAEEILTLQQGLGIASIVVTHDLPTAFTVADRAVVLNEGFVIFSGTLQEFVASSDPFLHEYLGASQLDRERHDKILAARASAQNHVYVPMEHTKE